MGLLLLAQAKQKRRQRRHQEIQPTTKASPEVGGGNTSLGFFAHPKFSAHILPRSARAKYVFHTQAITQLRAPNVYQLCKEQTGNCNTNCATVPFISSGAPYNASI
jgi:hypothetical protein